MNTQALEALDILRKLESNNYEPKIHGVGVVVGWNKKKREIVSPGTLLDKIFNGHNIQYFFVKTHKTPLTLENIPFEWREGTSAVSLRFNASFQLQIHDRGDAEKLVKALGETQSPENALHDLIDSHLNDAMRDIYSNLDGRNLLDTFFSDDLQHGEADMLSRQVSQRVERALNGLKFRIGFTLNDIPVRNADFVHNTQVKRGTSAAAFDVLSECTLKLSNYQAFKKSKIQTVENVINHMKQAIDASVREHIIGKSLLELLSNFEYAQPRDKPSISEQVRIAVGKQAHAIGFELNSFYSLPDLAPLKLLRGIRIDLDENEASFGTSNGGGIIKIDLALDAKAKEGEFDKQRHLLTLSSASQSIDLLDMSYQDIVERIKKPIIGICSSVIKRFTHKQASTEFSSEIYPALCNEIKHSMLDRFGLIVEIKELRAVESEDGERFRALASKPNTFSFTTVSTDSHGNKTTIRLDSSFKIIAIDMEFGWDAFEKVDFGYRANSPARIWHDSDIELEARKAPTSDAEWKSLAIKRELLSIEDQLIRYFRRYLTKIDNKMELFQPSADTHVFQKALLESAVIYINGQCGLGLQIDEITLDESVLIAALTSREDDNLKNIRANRQLNARLGRVEVLRQSRERNQLKNAVIDSKTGVIAQTEDMDELNLLDRHIEDTAPDRASPPNDIEDTLAKKSTKNRKNNALSHAIEHFKSEKPEE